MFILRYGDLGLVLMKQYFPKGTWTYFHDDAICTYFPEDDGLTAVFGHGTGSLQNKLFAPGSFCKLREWSKQGVLASKRQCFFVEQGYTICLSTIDNSDIDVEFVGQVNPTLPANTMAIVIGDSVDFDDNGILKKAEQYNLIYKRQYDVQIKGQSKLLFIKT